MSTIPKAVTADCPGLVRQFRQILLWPVHLVDPAADGGASVAADLLSSDGPDDPWHEVDDEFADPDEFQERHYYEFVSFLPPVQRFLYGQGVGRSVRHGYGESPIRVLRRRDVAAMRVVLMPGDAPVVFNVAHVDLYLFYDTDIAMLTVELVAEDLPLAIVQEALLRVGRAYPGRWNSDGTGVNCPAKVEWLGFDGAPLCASDYERRDKFLRHVCTHRAPAVAAHWEHVLQPLVQHYSDQDAALRFRQLEYYRMPIMAFVALDDPRTISPEECSRLAHASGTGQRPILEREHAAIEIDGSIEAQAEQGGNGNSARIRHFATGRTFVVVGSAHDADFVDPDRGSLGRFRHQHFLVFLIAQFHRAALLRFSDQLAASVSRLRVGDRRGDLAFRLEIKRNLEAFLRFTHRYWFHDVSGQVLSRALFSQCRQQLNIEQLYDEVRQEIEDMSAYLESERLGRQNASMVRLTVVTTFGLIGTVTTGFLGMNILAWAELPAMARLLIFAAVLAPAALLTLFTVGISSRLSEFLDALSNESLSFRGRMRMAARIWRRRDGPGS